MSSKHNGEYSLNDCLDPGPTVALLIYDILVFICMSKVTLIGDLDKAVISVKVDPKQRNLLRFLWYDEISKDEPHLLLLRCTWLVVG